MKKIKKIIFILLSFCIAAGIWFPCLSFLFHADIKDYRTKNGVALKAQMLAERQLRNWRNYSKKEKPC